MSNPNTVENQLPSGEISDDDLLELYSDHLPILNTIPLGNHQNLRILNYNTLSTWSLAGFNREESVEMREVRHARLVQFFKKADDGHNLDLIALQETTLDLTQQIAMKLGEDWLVLSQDGNRSLLVKKSKFDEIAHPQLKSPITARSSPCVNTDFLGGQLTHHQSRKKMAVFTVHTPYERDPSTAEGAVRKIRDEFNQYDLVIVAGDFNRRIAHIGSEQIDNANSLIPMVYRKNALGSKKTYDFTDGCFVIEHGRIVQNEGESLLPSAPTVKIERKITSQTDAASTEDMQYFPVMFSKNHVLPLSGKMNKHDQSVSMNVRQLQEEMRINFDDDELQIDVYVTRFNQKALLIHTPRKIPALETLGLRKINEEYYSILFDGSSCCYDSVGFRIQVGDTVKNLALSDLTTPDFLREEDNKLAIITMNNADAGHYAAAAGFFSANTRRQHGANGVNEYKEHGIEISGTVL